jgi:hypothetical protein
MFKREYAKMKHNIYQKVAVGYLVILVGLWAALLATGTKSGNWNYLYSLLFGLVPFFAGLIGMFKAKLWGGLKSALGKAIFFTSFGLFLWGLGENIWSYYNFVLHVPAPYPSLADIGFAPSIFFWIVGTYYLAKATGAFFALKKTHWAKIIVVVVPLLLLVPSYYIQITLARDGTLVPSDETVLKTVFDIAYPFGDFLALTIAAIVFTLSYKYFGGYYRSAVRSILAGLAIMYIGDSVFSYTTTQGTYYNANWGDMLLTLGLFFISYGILAFATTPVNPGKPQEGVEEGVA